VEVHVRPELARQVTDRESAGHFEGAQQRVTGKPRHRVLVGQDSGTARQDLAPQAPRGRAAYAPREKTEEHLVVHAREELGDVGFEDVAVLLDERMFERLAIRQRSSISIGKPLDLGVQQLE